MTAAIGTLTRKPKAVSFQSFVTVRKYTPVTDPEMKNQLYYSERDLKEIKIEAKRMIMEYKMHKKQQLLALSRRNQCQTSLALKRPVAPGQVFDETSNKRMRLSSIAAQ